MNLQHEKMIVRSQANYHRITNDEPQPLDEWFVCAEDNFREAVLNDNPSLARAIIEDVRDRSESMAVALERQLIENQNPAKE